MSSKHQDRVSYDIVGLIHKETFKDHTDEENRMCTSKKYFRDDEQANRELKRLQRKGDVPTTGYTYKCLYCNGSHISSGKRR